MYSALAGTLFILSIGILMAHAMEAFRWREGHHVSSVEPDVAARLSRLSGPK
jgi:hypothetical protein